MIIAIISAIILGILALEVRDMRRASVFLGGVFLLSGISSLIRGAPQTGIALLITGGVLTPLSLYVTARTTERDEVERIGKIDIILVVSLVFFLMVFFSFFPKVEGEGEGEFSALNIVRGVLILLAALASVWALLKGKGRGE